MDFTKPPIKEPLFISGTVLSPVWVRWFNELFAIAQVDSSTLLTMQTEQKESSTAEGSSPLMSFIPKANDQSSNSPVENIGVDLVMAVIPKGNDQGTLVGDIVNLQTLYWMGV